MEGDPTRGPKEVIKELSRLMKIIESYNIPMTLFISLEYADEFLVNLVEMSNVLHLFEDEGHEIGLHIHWGSWRYRSIPHEHSSYCRSWKSSLRTFTQKEIEEELKSYLQILRSLGFTAVSFRGGGLCQTTQCLRILHDQGFEIDSSVAPGLNEGTGWYQNHRNVSHRRGYYYPRKSDYSLPAENDGEKMGILEAPVSRMRISNGSWRSILEPAPNWKEIINWVVSYQTTDPKVLVPIFHSWCKKSFKILPSIKYAVSNQALCSIYNWHFPLMLDKMFTYLKQELGATFVTMKELKEELEKRDCPQRSSKELF